jgi:hypothetical protein
MWLTNEDGALKLKLQGIMVYDTNAPGGRTVPVKYRLPETEVSDLTYPCIVIDHDGWYPANDREHRGYTQVPYAPEGCEPWWDDTGPATTEFTPSDSPYWSFFPFPYNFDYQVTVYTRFMGVHTIPIVAQLAAYDRLHPKFAYLDIPQDGTKRTLQLLGGPSLVPEYDSNGKRVFASKYKIRVFSELLPEVVQYVSANQVNFDIGIYTSFTDLTYESLKESHGLLSVGSSLAWNTNQPVQ